MKLTKLFPLLIVVLSLMPASVFAHGGEGGSAGVGGGDGGIGLNDLLLEYPGDICAALLSAKWLGTVDFGSEHGQYSPEVMDAARSCGIIE